MNKLKIVDQICDCLNKGKENLVTGNHEASGYWFGRADGYLLALKNELEQEEKSNEHAGCKVFMRWCSTHKREVSECEKRDKSIMKEIREMREFCTTHNKFDCKGNENE